MAQSSRRTYGDPRVLTKSGDSLTVTLNKTGLRRSGFDPDELAGEEVYTEIDGDRVIIDLSDVE